MVYEIWTSITFSVVNDYYIWKGIKREFSYGIWRKSFEMSFRDVHFQKVKLYYQIWISINFLQWMTYILKISKKVFINKVWRKLLESFFRYSPLLLSFPVRYTPLLIFWILPSLKILSIHLSDTVYKIWWFYLYYFWRHEVLNFPPHSHACRQIFKNHFFGLKGLQTHKLGENLTFRNIRSKVGTKVSLFV